MKITNNLNTNITLEELCKQCTIQEICYAKDCYVNGMYTFSVHSASVVFRCSAPLTECSPCLHVVCAESIVSFSIMQSGLGLSVPSAAASKPPFGEIFRGGPQRQLQNGKIHPLLKFFSACGATPS